MNRTYVVAASAATAFFIQQLDATGVAVALPQMASSFGENPIRLNLVITSYVLSLTAVLPACGWLVDRLGARIVFQCALALFTAGSFWCGVSSGLVEMTIARILQGAGAAMMLPVGRLVVLRTADKAEYIQALALIQVPTQIGAAAGPLIGGLITTYASWRWIFLINVPIGIAGIILAGVFFENFKEAERRPFDAIGFVLIGAFLAAILYAFEAIGHRGFADTPGLIAVLCSVLLFGMAVRHALRHPHPLIDLKLLGLPTFRADVVGGTIYRLGADGLPFILPLLFQVMLHFTAFTSGVLTFISAAGAVLIRTVSPKIFRRFGFRGVLVNNALLSGAVIASYAFVAPDTPLGAIAALMFLGGMLQATQFVALNAMSYSDITPEQMSRATTLAQLGQRATGGFGVIIVSLVLQMLFTLRGASEPITSDFEIVFVVMGLLMGVSALHFRTLAPEAGHEVSSHRHGRP